MLIRRPDDIPSRLITDEKLFWDRRAFLAAVEGSALVTLPLEGLMAAGGRLGRAGDEKLTPYEAVTTYNNFYEFGTDKSDPAANSKGFRTRPWTVKVEGAVKKPATYHYDDFIAGFTPVEKVYRHRCVEGWSMVIPWMGIPLASIVARLEPTSTARFIEFTTILDPKQMSGQRANILSWPYVEALRMDEAMNPPTLMGTGVYGKPLLPQNGAPLRLVVPWKYGFKGGKSVVNIRFTETQPGTTWNIAVPNEYGFYANVNPEVDHPVQHIPAADPARGHVDRRDDPAAGWQAVAAAAPAGVCRGDPWCAPFPVAGEAGRDPAALFPRRPCATPCRAIHTTASH